MSYLTRVEQRGDQICTWTPFAPAYIADLKRAIPKSGRSWDPSEECWKVDASFRADLEALLWSYFGYLPEIHGHDDEMQAARERLRRGIAA